MNADLRVTIRLLLIRFLPVCSAPRPRSIGNLKKASAEDPRAHSDEANLSIVRVRDLVTHLDH
jgi:hypothetical protein